MSATQKAVSTFEGHASSAQATALELQRKVIGYSERNVGASLEFAQKLLQAKAPEEAMKLHADYVKAQMQALTEQSARHRPARRQGCHAVGQDLIAIGRGLIASRPTCGIL
jgi:hypothetical protein